MYRIDDPLFTSNSAANIFPYSFHIRKDNDQIKLATVKFIRHLFSLYDLLRVLFQKLPFVKSFFQTLLFTGIFQSSYSEG